jgi:predicted nucleic acid-binding protein
MGLEWMPPSATVMRRTVIVAREWDITVYDAAFVALAASRNATFITADEQLARRLEDLPFVRYLGDLGEG